MSQNRSISYSKLLKLSTTDILILQYLRRFQGNTVRITLLETLNSLFEEAKISTSSFYNRLDNLQHEGYISYVEDESSKGKLIDVTQRGKEAMTKINQFSLVGTTDFFSHTKKIFSDLLDKIDIKEKDKKSILFINLERGIDVRSMNLVTDIGENVFVLANDTTYTLYQGRGMSEEIKQTKHNDGKIREPADFFHTTVIVGYDRDKEAFGKSSEHWLSEALRVTRRGGPIIVNSVENPDPVNHVLIDSIIDELRKSQFFKKISPEELREELISLGLQKVDMVNYQGILYSWGRVPEDGSI